ncbi:hypothetical protein D3C76_837580 [compost metagenome]
MTPPSGMASRALVARLMIDSSSWFSSLSTGSSCAGKRVSMLMFAPRARSSRSLIPRISAGTSSGCGNSCCLRANASMRWVSAAPRRVASMALCQSSFTRGSSGRWRCSICRPPMITVSRLLKSCATPPVSWPSDSIFCDWISSLRARSSSSWALSLSVMSRVILAKPSSSPLSSRTWSMTMLAKNGVPSLRTCHASLSWRPSRRAVSRAISGSPAARSPAL